jgi:hypothetical protein
LGFCKPMQFKACNSLTSPLSRVLIVLRQWGSCQGNLMPGVSDLDFRTSFCQSVLVAWKGTGKIPKATAKGGESLVHSCCVSCCAISLNEVILTWCKLARHSPSMCPTYLNGPFTCHALVLKYFVVVLIC